jgi:chromosome segregation protein
MRLKRIELAGFKSFVDPTKIEIGEGITSIVGPNGSGKSNIVDALRWVLGEHSAKQLRGGVMDDLIFQGSDSRSPVAMCDVELTFAVQPGQLPSPYHEMDEIRIRRRMHRESGSDAFINGKMVRLKDIIDLFLDTGISTRAYAIIEQGSIARMLTAKPEERRELLEEAAGVVKYRHRRREAERKMKDTRQNLERVTDLLEEVATQCRSLKQQASRAERFKTMQDEFKDLQAISFGIRYRQAEAQLSEVRRELDEARTGEAGLASAHAQIERDLADARQATIRHEEGVQALQDRLRQGEQERARWQQELERLAGERRLLAERRGMLEQRIAEAGERLTQLGQEEEELAAKLAEQDDAALKSRLAQAQQALEVARTHYAEQSLQRDTLLSDYERIRHAFEDAGQRRQQTETAITRLQERQQRLQEQMDRTREQAQQADAAHAEAKAAIDAVSSRVQKSEQALQQAQQALDASRTEREASSQALGEHESTVRELSGRCQELRAQLSGQEVPDDLRELIRSKGGIWIDEKLQVPEGLELAVAAALRGRAADARMPTNPDMAAWREALDKASDAPIALYTDKAGGAEAAPNSLAAALHLAAEHPLHQLFATVSLVDDILAGAPEGRCVVNRAGWRREADGWLVPPAGNQTARRLTLTRQLHDAETRLQAETAALETARARFEAAEQALTERQLAWQQCHLQTTEDQSARHDRQAAAQRLQTEAETIRERLARLQAEQQEMGEELDHWQQQLAGQSTLDRRELDVARESLDKQSESMKQAEHAMSEAREDVAAAEQAMALFSQAQQALLRERERLQAEQARLSRQSEEDNERMIRTGEELAQSEHHADLDRHLAEAVAQVDGMHRELSELRQHGHALQQSAHEQEQAERQARQRLQEGATRRQEMDVRIAADEARLQDLADEIGQRCHTSTAELLQRLQGMDEPPDPEVVLRQARDMEERLERFGPVNLLAIEEYEQAAERERFLSEQARDLEASLETLTETIARIDRTTRQRFKEVFEQTNALFQQTFPRLFGGGRAELRLDADDVLTAGVEVIAQPPGKRLQDVSLLSGGEKALTAVALVFSIFRIKPAPFCILDEVDAPMDDANVGRFGEMVRELTEDVQFLAITHNKITMQLADRLIGVSMPEPGVSRIVGVEMDAPGSPA